MISNQKVCRHYHNVKKEKFCNILQQRSQISKCDNIQKQKCESDTERWLCIDCGFLGCSRNSDQRCSLQHFISSKHKLVVSLSSYVIWCYDCDDDFESMITTFEEEGDELPESVQQLKNFNELIRQAVYNSTNNQKKKVNNQQIQKIEPKQQQIQMKVASLNYVPSKVFGLKNLGNTCFFNSVMQCLNGAQALTTFYLDLGKMDFSLKENQQVEQEDDGWTTIQDISVKKKKGQLQKRQTFNGNGNGIKNINWKYQEFLISARKSKGNCFDPTDLFKAVSVIFNLKSQIWKIPFNGIVGCLGVTEMFLRYLINLYQLIDALSTGEEKVMKSRSENIHSTQGKAKITVIENIFGSYLCNYCKLEFLFTLIVECLDCGGVSRTFDFCLDLLVQIGKPKSVIDVQILREQKISQNFQKQDTNNQTKSQFQRPSTDSQEDVKDEKEDSDRNSDQEFQLVQTNQKNRKNSKKTSKQKPNQRKKKMRDEQKQEEQKKQEIEVVINEIQDGNSNSNTEPINQSIQVVIQDLEGGGKQEKGQVEELGTATQINLKPQVSKNWIPYKDQYYIEVPQKEILEDRIPYFDHDYDNLYQRVEQQNQQKPKQLTSAFTIYDCLDAFTGFEFLNMKTNYFKCENCQKLRKKSSRALRKFYLYDTPKILTLVLKRFCAKPNGRFEKVGDHVEFDEYLDIGNYVLSKGSIEKNSQDIIEETIKAQKYKLCGVVVHSGTMHGGHYIAYVRHQENQEDHWFYFSDTTYKEVTIKQVLQAQAYILFYEKFIL